MVNQPSNVGGLVLAVVLAVVLAAPARARASPVDTPDERSRAGVAAAAVFPVGAWADTAGQAAAAGAWLEVPVSPRAIITARAGLVVHDTVTVAPEAELRLIEVPVLGGVRLEVARYHRLFVVLGADLGLSLAHERVSLRGVTEGDTTLRIAGALAAGVVVAPVAIELGPWFADLTEPRATVGVQLSVLVRLRAW